MIIKRTLLALSLFVFCAHTVRSDGFFMSTQSSDVGTSSLVQEGNSSVKTSQNITQENGFTVTVTEKTTKKPVENARQNTSQSSQSFQDEQGCTVMIEEQTSTENGFETTVKKTTRKCKNQPEVKKVQDKESPSAPLSDPLSDPVSDALSDPLSDDMQGQCSLEAEPEATAEPRTQAVAEPEPEPEPEAEATAEPRTKAVILDMPPKATEKVDIDQKKLLNQLNNLKNEINRRLGKKINSVSRLSQLLNDSMFGPDFPWE